MTGSGRMASRGWRRSDHMGRWELRDEHGDMVGAIADEVVARGGVSGAARAARRRGWPEFTGRPAAVCLLVGGPQDGRRVYVDAREPPAELTFDAAPFPDGPAAVGLPPPAVYLRRPQACGHGWPCPYPYLFAGLPAAQTPR